MRRAFFAVLAVLAAAGGAQAQTFPSKPITVVIPLAAGGAVDTNVRIMLESMRVTLGQPILVENNGGAGGGPRPHPGRPPGPPGPTHHRRPPGTPPPHTLLLFSPPPPAHEF